ncbi:MAG: hypothetical protein H6607_08330 [Flavobacteriales bacterium]|nr:hypothetical protein [Flavobacteriales bacterium]
MITVALARNIHDKASQKLESEKKSALLDFYTKNRVRSLILMVVLVVVFLFLSEQMPERKNQILGGYAILLSLYIVINAYINTKKLRNEQFPQEFIKALMLSNAVRVIGIVAILVYLMFIAN